MSDLLEETASNEPNSPERERSRSPPPPPPPPPPVQEAVDVVADLSRRTCPVCMRLFDSAKAMWGHSWVHKERRDQIYAMNPPIPPPPPPPPANGAALAVGGGGSGGGGSGGAAGWHPWKIDSREERDRTCPRCKKVFGSPKAMFGHLHVHYERSSTTAKTTRGDVVAGPSHAGPAAPTPALVPPRDVEEDSPVTSIDLNRPAREVEVEEEVEEEEGDSSMMFDLNLTPPSS